MKTHNPEELVIDLKRKFRGVPKLARRVVSLILCAGLMLNLCSCWSRRELNTLAIVLATAFDAGDKPDTLSITAQVVKVGEIKSGSSSAGTAQGQKAYVNFENTDQTVLSALDGITHTNSRSMYFSHNRILILSRELAEKGISEELDAFTRNYETRMNVYILISKGKASEILSEELELEKIPANHIAEMLENQKTNSETEIVTLRDFDIAMLSESMAPVAPMIELFEVDGKKEARLEGTAVFKKGKMVGQLNVKQTRGLMWATGKAREGIITISTKWGQVDLKIMHSQGSFKPVKTEDGTIPMKLKIDVEGCVESNETMEDMSSLKNIEMLQKLAQEYIRDEIESVLKQTKALSADVFGFGEAIRRDYPKDREKMKENWDEEFCKIASDLEINVKLNCTGGIGKPMVPGGAE